MALTYTNTKCQWEIKLMCFHLNEKRTSNLSMFCQIKLKLGQRGSVYNGKYVNLIFHCLYCGLY